MTNQEINERVAKLCGWFPVEDTESGLWHLSNTKGKTIGYRSGLNEDHAWRVLTPNYAESLDACGEFESAMNAQEWSEYRQWLFPCAAGETCVDFKESKASLYPPNFTRGRAFSSALPIHRCEAFLRLKGQWDEN
jgi:hypothetical protein